MLPNRANQTKNNNINLEEEKENEKFYDEKIKNYEKFKNTSLDNKSGILKLKKILLLRTHSKKTKRRGRKRKNNNLPYEEIMNLMKDKKNKINKIIILETWCFFYSIIYIRVI